MCSHHAKSACYCSLFVREDLLAHYLCLQSPTPLTTKLWLQTSWGKWSHSSPEPSWLCSSICQEEEEVGLGEGNTCIACPLTASDLTPSVLLCFGVWLFPCMQGLQGKVWWTCTFIYLFIFWLEFSLSTPVPFFYAMVQSIVAQWLSDVRWLWLNIPWWATCELVSRGECMLICKPCHLYFR